MFNQMIKKFISHTVLPIFPIFLLALGYAMLINTPAHAQLLDKASSAQDVASVFYKLVGAKPNFEEWAQDTKLYQTALKQNKADVLAQEAINLEIAYNALDLSNTAITVRTSLRGSVKNDRNPVLNLDFLAEGPLFFPYSHTGIDYALIAENIDKFREIPLGALEANYVRSKIPSENTLYMILKIKPYRADASEPITIQNSPYFPILGRIGSIQIYNSRLETVWSWAADWYEDNTVSDNDIESLKR